MSVPLGSVAPEELLGPLTDVERKAAPTSLYYEGDRGLLESGPRVAIVGSRGASAQGLEEAQAIAGELVSRNVVVVSGLALGIDTAAHRAAIEEGGKTVAVLGTPLDQYAVGQNRELQDTIGADHLLVSQFAPETPVHRSNFPRRNKTMALLSDATIIVEAAENSGTRHQGWEAIRLGRTVLFCGGVLNRQGLVWPHKMMEYGAVRLDVVELGRVLDSLPYRTREPVVF